MKRQGYFKRLLAGLILVITVSPAVASMPDGITNEERALLPRWCNYVQLWHGKDGEPMYRRLVERYGRGFTHIHHYCWALIDIIRLDRWNGRDAGGSLLRAIGNIDYVLNQTEDDRAFPFRAEILARKARLLARFSNPSEGAKVAEKLILEWPTLPDGYLILADLMVRLGNKEKALQVLAVGEKNVENRDEYARQRALLNLAP